MFIRLGLNKQKSLNTLPLQSFHLLVSLVSLMTKTKSMIVYKIFLWFQKSGTKSRGVLLFVPLRRFYAVLFVPLFCRLRDKCGTLWKTTWLHNVDNIRQKDIKKIISSSFLNSGTLIVIFSIKVTPRSFKQSLQNTNDFQKNLCSVYCKERIWTESPTHSV